MKSGKTLKEFRGHGSYINDCLFTADVSVSTQQVVSASADGTVKVTPRPRNGAQSPGKHFQFQVWDARTTNCLHTFSPPQDGGARKEISVHSLSLLPQNVEQIGESSTSSVSARPNQHVRPRVVVCNRSSTLYVMSLQGAVRVQ